MKKLAALLAVGLSVGLGGCLPPVNSDTVELAWERCQGAADAALRLNECSVVIGFSETSPERRAAALLMRGSIRSAEGDYARALADLGRALRIDRNNPQIYLQRGALYQERGIYENAMRDFDLALALEPGLRSALDRRAEVVQQRASAYLRDLSRLNDFLTSNPNDAEMLNSRCWLRTVNNDSLDLALADCNASLAVAPNDANVHDSRGLTYFKRGDFAASLADYETAVSLEPERGHFLYGRGLARLALGLRAEGNADLTRAEQLEPGIARDYESYNITMPKPAPLEAD
ncbi:MAG: tetratricopeptide repeat protein [Hyphomonadaceae bacterium]